MRKQNYLTLLIVASLLGTLQLACSGGDAAIEKPSSILQLREIRRIPGRPNPQAPATFTGIGSLTLDDAGKIIIADRPLQVQVFAYSGWPTALRAFGMRGGERGKFGTIARLMVHGDTIAVYDPALGRVTRFDANGNVASIDELTSPDNWHVIPYALVDSGWVVRLSHSKARALGLHRDTMTLRRVASIAEAFAMAPVWDTATTPTLPVHAVTQLAWYDSAQVTVPLFTAHPDVAVDARGRMYVSDGQKYEISVYDADGKFIRRMTRPHTPVAITRGMINKYLERAPESERARKKIPREKYLPALGQLLVSRGGDVWVERTDLTDDPYIIENKYVLSHPRYYDLFDPNGGFRGTVLIPEGFTPRAIMARSVVGVLRDRKNQEFITAYSVTY